ncbi:uroporphyrinogen decarboxylase family protein [Candidatus Latescibacterota bacterium]
MRIEPLKFLPVEIVFHPNWWHNEAGINFDRDNYFDPVRRVEDEKRMRRILWERFGGFGYGEESPLDEPVIGPVHLAAGYMFSSLWGCELDFPVDSSPVVIPRSMTVEELLTKEIPDPSENREFGDLFKLIDSLKDTYGYVKGDINWNGVQNLALDLMGERVFMTYYDNPSAMHTIFEKITKNLIEILNMIKNEMGTTSISVNRSIENVEPTINLHSNCSVQMVSNEIYEEFLLPADILLSENLQPYGIHHCGDNMHNVAAGYSKVKEACFFDVGWGADIAYCRKMLPDAFFNVRLSPVKIKNCTPAEVESDLVNLLENAGDLTKVGICCINMDYGTPDENVAKIFEVAERYRG